jgi:hypothetical protein
MPHAHIKGAIWHRRIHETWENAYGYRTDIAASVLENPAVTKALFELDDKRSILISMEALRTALQHARRRDNGMVGPFNLNPHSSAIDGIRVEMEILIPKAKDVPVQPEPETERTA